MILDLTLFGLAVLMAVLAVRADRPRPPALDPERLFKTVQASLLRNEVAREGGRAEAWTERVLASVLYHPAGREGWAKLEEPTSWVPPVPALPGERALLEDLSRLGPGLPRFGRLFGGDPVSRVALLDDPATLGPAWDPAGWLGPGCDWDAVATWSPPVRSALDLRLGHLRFVLVDGGTDAAGAFAEALSEAVGDPARVHVLPATGPGDLGALARGLLHDASDRVVTIALGDAGPVVLDALRTDPVLRDHTAAVVLDGCPLGGVPEEPPPGLSVEDRAAWATAHLSQEAFDTELRRSVPWFLVQRLTPTATPPGDGRVPWALQRIAEPPIPPSGRRPVAVVDLGPVPAGAGAPPPSVLARAILLVIASQSR